MVALLESIYLVIVLILLTIKYIALLFPFI